MQTDKRDPIAIGVVLQSLRQEHPGIPLSKVADKLDSVMIRNYGESPEAYELRYQIHNPV